jgi:uncharacterized protein YhfF
MDIVTAKETECLAALAEDLATCFGAGARSVALWRADHARRFSDTEWAVKWRVVAELCGRERPADGRNAA